MRYLQILLFFSCTTQIDEPQNQLLTLNTQSEIWTDTIYFNAVSGLQYHGEWLDSDYGKIADKNTQNSVLKYVFTGIGIDIYTYVDGHHGGCDISFDGDHTYIDLSFKPREVRKIFSIAGLRNIKHTLIITPDPGKTFVFQKFIKFVDSIPDTGGGAGPVDCVPDTIYVRDTIYLPQDTIILQPKIFIKADDYILELK